TVLSLPPLKETYTFSKLSKVQDILSLAAVFTSLPNPIFIEILPFQITYHFIGYRVRFISFFFREFSPGHSRFRFGYSITYITSSLPYPRLAIRSDYRHILFCRIKPLIY